MSTLPNEYGVLTSRQTVNGSRSSYGDSQWGVANPKENISIDSEVNGPGHLFLKINNPPVPVEMSPIEDVHYKYSVGTDSPSSGKIRSCLWMELKDERNRNKTE